MTNEVRHLRAVMYKINHRVAGVRWREAELFGTYGYFDNFREPFECRFLQAPSECKDDEGRRLGISITLPRAGGWTPTPQTLAAMYAAGIPEAEIGAGIHPLPLLEIGNPFEPADKIVRPLCDVAHQMFGKKESPCFGLDGSLVGPTV